MLFIGSVWAQKMDLCKTGYDFLYAGIDNHFYIDPNVKHDTKFQCTNASALRKGDTLTVKPYRTDSTVNIIWISEQNDTILNKTFRSISLPKPGLMVQGETNYGSVDELGEKLQALASPNIAENVKYRVLSFDLLTDNDVSYSSNGNSFTDEMRGCFDRLVSGSTIQIHAKVAGPDGKVLSVAGTFIKSQTR